MVIAADALVESTAILDTQIGMTTAIDDGYGLSIMGELEPGTGAQATVRGSIVAGSYGYGLISFGSVLELESIVVRDVVPRADGMHGLGMHVQENFVNGDLPDVTLRSSLVERSYHAGIAVYDGPLTMEGVVVRQVRDNPAEPPFNGARGMQFGQVDVVAKGIVVEAVEGIGLLPSQTRGEFAGLSVHDITPGVDGWLGYGVAVLDSTDLLFDGSRVENILVGGILGFSSQFAVRSTLVRSTASSSGLFGDGIGVQTSSAHSSLSVEWSRIEASARAGIVSFGADVQLTGVALECNLIALGGEAQPAPFSFENLGGNTCGCNGETDECKVLSSALAPPDPPSVAAP